MVHPRYSFDKCDRLKTLNFRGVRLSLFCLTVSLFICIILCVTQGGAKVVIVDVDCAEAAVQDICTAASGGQVVYVQGNVAMENTAQRMVETAVQTFGRLDILFSNAGILGDRKPVTETTAEEMDKILSVNLKGAIFGAKYAIPVMKRTANGGVILHTGSDTAFQGNQSMPVYSATKGALLALTRALAADHAADGIRCNMVSPCVTQTQMTDSIRVRQPDFWQQLIQSTIPLGRACQPEDVAKAALFLASDDASFITGENLMVDGGTIAKGV